MIENRSFKIFQILSFYKDWPFFGSQRYSVITGVKIKLNVNRHRDILKKHRPILHKQGILKTKKIGKIVGGGAIFY